MKFNYDKETDSLYIHFINIPGVDSKEISNDFIADFNEEGQMIGLEVLNVKDKFDIKTLQFDNIIAENIKFTQEV